MYDVIHINIGKSRAKLVCVYIYFLYNKSKNFKI